MYTRTPKNVKPLEADGDKGEYCVIFSYKRHFKNQKEKQNKVLGLRSILCSPICFQTTVAEEIIGLNSKKV